MTRDGSKIPPIDEKYTSELPQEIVLRLYEERNEALRQEQEWRSKANALESDIRLFVKKHKLTPNPNNEYLSDIRGAMRGQLESFGIEWDKDKS